MRSQMMRGYSERMQELFGLVHTVVDYNPEVDTAEYVALYARFQAMYGFYSELPKDASISDAIMTAARALVADLRTMDWNREITMRRRAAWNALARQDVGPADCEAELGYTMVALKAAVARHGL